VEKLCEKHLFLMVDGGVGVGYSGNRKGNCG